MERQTRRVRRGILPSNRYFLGAKQARSIPSGLGRTRVAIASPFHLDLRGFGVHVFGSFY